MDSFGFSALRSHYPGNFLETNNSTITSNEMLDVIVIFAQSANRILMNFENKN